MNGDCAVLARKIAHLALERRAFKAALRVRVIAFRNVWQPDALVKRIKMPGRARAFKRVCVHHLLVNVPEVITCYCCVAARPKQVNHHSCLRHIGNRVDGITSSHSLLKADCATDTLGLAVAKLAKPRLLHNSGCVEANVPAHGCAVHDQNKAAAHDGALAKERDGVCLAAQRSLRRRHKWQQVAVTCRHERGERESVCVCVCVCVCQCLCVCVCVCVSM